MRRVNTLLLALLVFGLTSAGILVLLLIDQAKRNRIEMEFLSLSQREQTLTRRLDELKYRSIVRYSKFSKGAFFEGSPAYNKENPELPHLTSLQKTQIQKINEIGTIGEVAWLQNNRARWMLLGEAKQKNKKPEGLSEIRTILQNADQLINEMETELQNYDKIMTSPK